MKVRKGELLSLHFFTLLVTVHQQCVVYDILEPTKLFFLYISANVYFLYINIYTRY